MPELSSRYGVKRLALFGSFVRGEQGPGSDVDAVVELEHPLGFDFVDLVERLEGAKSTCSRRPRWSRSGYPASGSG